MSQLQYFGTSVDRKGHFLWDINEYGLYNMSLNHIKLPFDPEALPEYEKGEPQNKGDVKFYQRAGYVICAILGRCIDDRGGCESVFFVKGPYCYNDLMQMIRESKPAQEIINAFPFPLVSKMPFELNIKA